MRLPPKKPTRQRSRVEKLPERVREELLRRATEGQSWAEIRQWLRTSHRCRINSDSVLSMWYSRRVLAQEVADSVRVHSEQVEAMVEALKQELPNLPQEKLDRFGQNAFQVMALKSSDPKVWAQIYRLRLKERELVVEEGKLELLKRRADQAERAEGVMRDEALTPEERERRIKEVFGLS